MSALVITVRRNDEDGPMQLIVAGPGTTALTPLDGVDEFLLADVLRHVDRIAFGQNPGPCERFMAAGERDSA
jgi:hypothetical protein